MIPAKADPEQQAAYLKQELEPRLAAAQAGQRAVFFVDAAHFVLAPFLGFLWSLELCFLPAYSPNLNLIERLWKFVKKQSLYSKYYADFASFKTAIADCLSQTHTTHKEALDSLLTLRFQTFEKAQPMTVRSILTLFSCELGALGAVTPGQVAAGC